MTLITYSEAAVLLAVPVGTLYAWVHEQRIPHVRMGQRTVRFDKDALTQWIKARTQEPADRHTGGVHDE